jgi:hypothetical protein
MKTKFLLLTVVLLLGVFSFGQTVEIHRHLVDKTCQT